MGPTSPCRWDTSGPIPSLMRLGPQRIEDMSRTYRYVSLRAGDYREYESRAKLTEAMRENAMCAVSPDERWHAREELSYALACRSILYAPWMGAFLGESK